MFNTTRTHTHSFLFRHVLTFLCIQTLGPGVILGADGTLVAQVQCMLTTHTYTHTHTHSFFAQVCCSLSKVCCSLSLSLYLSHRFLLSFSLSLASERERLLYVFTQTRIIFLICVLYVLASRCCPGLVRHFLTYRRHFLT